MSYAEDRLTPEQEALIRARVRERVHQTASLCRELMQGNSGGLHYLPWRQAEQFAIALGGLDRLIAELDDLS